MFIVNRNYGRYLAFVAPNCWVTRIGNFIYYYLSLSFYFATLCSLRDKSVEMFPRFKVKYESPILRGNEKNASDREKHIGSRVAKVMLFCTRKKHIVLLEVYFFPYSSLYISFIFYYFYLLLLFF